MTVHRCDAVRATVRADHLARLERLAGRRGLDRSELVGKAVDGLLARDALAGGYLGPEHGSTVHGRATEEVTAPVRSDHLRRLDDLAERRGVDRSELIGRAIDEYLAQESLLGAFGVADTAVWFAPARDASIWATRRAAASSGRRWGVRKGPGGRRRSGSNSAAT